MKLVLLLVFISLFAVQAQNDDEYELSKEHPVADGNEVTDDELLSKNRQESGEEEAVQILGSHIPVYKTIGNVMWAKRNIGRRRQGRRGCGHCAAQVRRRSARRRWVNRRRRRFRRILQESEGELAEPQSEVELAEPQSEDELADDGLFTTAFGIASLVSGGKGNKKQCWCDVGHRRRRRGVRRRRRRNSFRRNLDEENELSSEDNEDELSSEDEEDELSSEDDEGELSSEDDEDELSSEDEEDELSLENLLILTLSQLKSKQN